jgi:uncharacterized protein (TIGR02001 family)
MKTRRFAIAGAASALLATSLGSMDAALADSPHSVSANISGTTNYMFRGISQTGNSPAVQGGFDYEYTPYGLYAGVWGSNVKSAGFGGASMELDIYAGWKPTWEKLSFDLGYLRYQYPTTDYTDNNTNEYHLGVSYDFTYLVPSFTANYSDDWYGTGSSWYYDLSVDVPLPYDVTLSGHYGWSQFDSTLDNYQDWKVAVSRDFYGFGFELAYVDTSSIDKSVNCGNVTFKCDGTAVFTVSKSF